MSDEKVVLDHDDLRRTLVRIAHEIVEKNEEARAIMEDAMGEEFKHFGMDLEFLLRRSPRWRDTLKGILFQPGDIVQHAEEAEEETEDEPV